MANKYVCVAVYTVRAGDTLYSIAQHYNVDVGLLMRANRIHNPYNLRIGVKLCIPGVLTEDSPQEPEVSPDPMPIPVPDPMPDPLPSVPDDEPSLTPDADPDETGRSCLTIHTVAEGDTLYMIAKMHSVALEDLMEANPGIDPYNMQIGTELCIPG